jgi:pimeloyl-ACP methyl ester carboxylesterase
MNKKTQGRDIAGLLDVLKLEKTDLVTHDIGNMVGYAFAAQYRGRVTRFVVLYRKATGRSLCRFFRRGIVR